MQGYNKDNQVFQLYPNLGEVDKDSGNSVRYPNVGGLNVYNTFQYNPQVGLRNEYEGRREAECGKMNYVSSMNYSVNGIRSEYEARREPVYGGFNYMSQMHYSPNGLQNHYEPRKDAGIEAGYEICNNTGSIYPQLPEIELNKGKLLLGEEKIQKKNEKIQYSSFVQPRSESFEGSYRKDGAAFRTTVEGYVGILDELRLDEEEKGKSVKLSENDDVLLCSITQEVMKDPVITPYGHCFDRIAIEEWLGKNKVCPITGKPLEPSQLIPCYPLKNIIQSLK